MLMSILKMEYSQIFWLDVCILDDVDTELLRQLAAKAMQVNKIDKSKKGRSKFNETSSSFTTDIR